MFMSCHYQSVQTEDEATTCFDHELKLLPLSHLINDVYLSPDRVKIHCMFGSNMHESECCVMHTLSHGKGNLSEVTFSCIFVL